MGLKLMRIRELSQSAWRRAVSRRWLPLLLACIAFLWYLPALGNGFVWDDITFLSDLPLYRDPTLWREALRQPFVISPNYFRPLALLTFVAEVRAAGLTPAWFHLTNVLLHAANTALVAFLARRVWSSDSDDAGQNSGLSSEVVAMVGAGLLYGLHAALFEGVAFVSSRFDLLLTTFLLLALGADVELRDRRLARTLAVGVAFLLAALTKEMAAAFALVLPVWHVAVRGRSLRPLRRFWRDVRRSGDLLTYVAIVVAGVVYLAIRYATLGYLLQPLSGIPTGTALQHLLLVARSLSEYALLVVWPFTTLSPIHYSALPIPVDSPVAWASVVAVLGLGAGLVKLVRTAPRSGWLAIAGTLSLLPVINVGPLDLAGGAFVAERFLLFPMTLFVLAAAPLFRPLAAWDVRPSSVRGVLGRLLPLLWLVTSALVIQVTLPHWRSDRTLWEWTARRAPQSAIPPTNLARLYTEAGGPEAGLAAAQHAIDLDPDSAMAWNNAGLALFHQDRYAEAGDAFQHAADLQPGNPLFWNNLAATLMERGQPAEAERVLREEALGRNPNHPLAHLNMGAVYLQLDRPDLAAEHLQTALRLLPADQPANVAKARDLLAQVEEPDRWLRLGDLLLGRNDPEGALRAFEQAEALGASPADAAVGKSAALIDLQKWEQAETVIRGGLESGEDDARLYNNLGVVAREQGDTEAARTYFQRAISLRPEWELPRRNLAALE